jgi:hypothetical protein
MMMNDIYMFWSGDDDNSTNMCWFAWMKILLHKYEGGMGSRDFDSFNLAMLAKQVQRLLKELESLCGCVLVPNTILDGNILKAGPKVGSLFTWQSIVAGLTMFKRGYV